VLCYDVPPAPTLQANSDDLKYCAVSVANFWNLSFKTPATASEHTLEQLQEVISNLCALLIPLQATKGASHAPSAEASPQAPPAVATAQVVPVARRPAPQPAALDIYDMLDESWGELQASRGARTSLPGDDRYLLSPNLPSASH